MKLLIIVMMVLPPFVLEADAQPVQCLQSDFSGEARPDRPFSQRIASGVTLSVDPQTLREDPLQRWFVIQAIGDDASPFVFHLSDTNWALAASDFWAAFIGGPQTDLRQELRYRSRHLLVPLSVEEKEKARKAAYWISAANTPEQERKAIAALNAVQLAQVDFEITNFALGGGEPPVSVEWVAFNITVILPRAFTTTELAASPVDCRTIPADVIADLKNPRRHKYVSSREEEFQQGR